MEKIIIKNKNYKINKLKINKKCRNDNNIYCFSVKNNKLNFKFDNKQFFQIIIIYNLFRNKSNTKSFIALHKLLDNLPY